MSQSNYAKNKIQDHLLGAISFTPPSNFYMGLSTTAITTSGSGASEPVGAGYARVQIPNTKSYFTYSSSGCIVNSQVITFLPSSGSWGTITDIAMWDSASSGSIWLNTTLTIPKIVQSDTTVSFSACAITFSQT